MLLFRWEVILQKIGTQIKLVYGRSGYKDFMTLRQALVWSANVPAVRLAYKLGVQNVYENLKKFGFSTLTDKDRNNLAIAIGGFTYGVKPIELTAAFAAVANDGVYIRLYFIERIEDSYGNVIYQCVPYKKRVMEEKNAYLLTDMLLNVVKAGITVGTIFNYPVAGKTGITDDNKDRWFVGYTPDYVLGVWVGEDQPKSLNYISDVNPAVMIFKGIMNKVVRIKGINNQFPSHEWIYGNYVYKNTKEYKHSRTETYGPNITVNTTVEPQDVSKNDYSTLNSNSSLVGYFTYTNTQKIFTQTQSQNSSGTMVTQNSTEYVQSSKSVNQEASTTSQQMVSTNQIQNKTSTNDTAENSTSAEDQNNGTTNLTNQPDKQSVGEEVYGD